MTRQADTLLVNGWAIYAHPCFLDQIEALVEEVDALKQKLPQEFHKKNAAKRLAAIAKLVLEVIPLDPENETYRQGETLGDNRKHWFRAKFFQQYRLFFRYHKASKIIVLGWVNDDETKRAYGSASDAYKAFAKMLTKKHPPDDWEDLLAQASAASKRLARSLDSVPQ